MDIEEQFIEYKNITLAIMGDIKSEKYETLEELFSKRQSILDNISSNSYSKEELNLIYKKVNINKLEKTLEEEMKNRKEELLNKIKESQKRRNVMNGYNNLQARAVFLSKKL